MQFIQWAAKRFDVILWTWEMPYDQEIKRIENLIG